jgi:hypothetical protein
MSAFKYSPLEEGKHQIRLLQILPRQETLQPEVLGEKPISRKSEDDGDVVECSIQIVSLDDKPKYNCLSYFWGDETNTAPVMVDGYFMDVTVSLEGALRQLRSETDHLILWADAICINQKDRAERSSQVQFMQRIYQHAWHVFAWLGPCTEDTDIAIEYLNALGKDAEAANINNLSLTDINSILSPDTREDLKTFKDSLEDIVKNTMFKIPWANLQEFFVHPWFNRVWVIQEMAVPSDDATIVMCGDKNISFQLLKASRLFITYFRMRFAHNLVGYTESPKKAAFWYQMNRNNSGRIAIILSSRRSYKQEGNRPQQSLFQLLIQNHVISADSETIGATDPRDRVYAILGLAKDGQFLNIKVDYQKPCAEVYTDAAAAMLKAGHFDILALNQFPKGENFEDKKPILPSWVPDWTSRIQRPCGGYTTDNCNRACGTRAGSVSFRSTGGGGKTLFITGCVVDKITKVGTPWLPTIEDWHDWVFNKDRYLLFFDEIADFCNESDVENYDIYSNSLMRRGAAWRIPFGNIARSGLIRHRPSPDGNELLEAYNCIKSGIEPDVSSKKNLDRTYRVALGDMFKRRPFISSRGYVGLAPAHAEAEDLICILYGCIVPYILRRNKTGTGYELVGESYAHGVMDGEFVEVDRPTETFEIH